MSNPFDDAAKQYNVESTRAKSTGTGSSPFDSAAQQYKEANRMGFGENVGQALIHTITGLNPMPILKMAGNVVGAVNPMGTKESRSAAQSELKQQFIDPSLQQLDMAKQQFQAGDYGQAIARTAAAIPIAGPAVTHAFDEYDRTGNWGAPVGDAAAMLLMKKAPKAVAKGLRAAGEYAYENALHFREGIPLSDRMAMVKRGLQTGDSLPVNIESLDKLGVESKIFKQEVNRLTKDPSSPFSQQTIPIDQVLKSVDDWINNTASADPKVFAQAKLLRDHWAGKLGYKPATTVPNTGTGPIVTPQGAATGQAATTGTTTIPAVTHTTIKEIQTLKENLNSLTKSSSYDVHGRAIDSGATTATYKAGLSGMKSAIEGTVAPIHDLNNLVHVDLMLKDAIYRAIRNKPSWLSSYTGFIAGVGVAELLNSGGKFGAALTEGALVRAAAANPAIMSRLGIALNSAGVKLPAEFLSKAAVPTGLVNANASANASANVK